MLPFYYNVTKWFDARFSRAIYTKYLSITVSKLIVIRKEACHGWLLQITRNKLNDQLYKYTLLKRNL